MRAFSYVGHFRSRDKDGGHITWSAAVEKPVIHKNFVALSFIEPELWSIEVLHCGNRDFRLFCSRNLDLGPTTFIYELNPYFLKIHRMCKYELPTSRLSKVMSNRQQTDRKTRPKLYTPPPCGWSTICIATPESCTLMLQLRATLYACCSFHTFAGQTSPYFDDM